MEGHVELKLPAMAGFQPFLWRVKMRKFEEETITLSPSTTSYFALPVPYPKLKDSENLSCLSLCFVW